MGSKGFNKANFDKEKYKSEKAKEIKDISLKIEDGIKKFRDSELFKNYLKVMSKFHKYSFNNSLLIYIQRPDSQLVAGYSTWKKVGRQVKKGSKGIRIFLPTPYKTKEQVERINPVTKVKEKTEEEVTRMSFKLGSVFDISDTEGKEIPRLCSELQGNAEQLAAVIKASEDLTGIKIEYEDIKGGAKGYFDPKNKRVVVKENLSEKHQMHTVIHETAHAMLHGNMKNDGISREMAETQAEAISLVCCEYFGLDDVSEYSFPYLSSWANDSELSDLKKSLQIIQETSMAMIDKIEEKIKEMEHDSIKKDTKEDRLDNIIELAKMKSEDFNKGMPVKDKKVEIER